MRATRAHSGAPAPAGRRHRHSAVQGAWRDQVSDRGGGGKATGRAARTPASGRPPRSHAAPRPPRGRTTARPPHRHHGEQAAAIRAHLADAGTSGGRGPAPERAATWPDSRAGERVAPAARGGERAPASGGDGWGPAAGRTRCPPPTGAPFSAGLTQTQADAARSSGGNDAPPTATPPPAGPAAERSSIEAAASALTLTPWQPHGNAKTRRRRVSGGGPDIDAYSSGGHFRAETFYFLGCTLPI
jgi:hypothetical protein